jgi:hypothetical protein
MEIDEQSGKLLGSPRTIGLMTGVLRDLAIARDGQRLVVSELGESLNLTRLLWPPVVEPREVPRSSSSLDRFGTDIPPFLRMGGTSR